MSRLNLIQVYCCNSIQSRLHGAGWNFEGLEKKRSECQYQGCDNQKHLYPVSILSIWIGYKFLFGCFEQFLAGFLESHMINCSPALLIQVFQAGFDFLYCMRFQQIPLGIQKLLHLFAFFTGFPKFFGNEPAPVVYHALSTLMKASWGILTEPMDFIRFLPAFCFSNSFRFREISPP